jgi:serine phosphatase RsbU (regulator of sigma subunit)
MAVLSSGSRPAVLRFPLACDLAQVRHAAQQIRQFLAEYDCGHDLLMACELAFVEGCNNAVKYAPTARDRPVLVEVSCDAEEVELRVTDHTTGFDWPAEVKLPEADSESGRGLYLMQSVMDEVKYLRGEGENVLLLRKRRPNESVPFLLQSREDELARGIQQSLLLKELPVIDGFEIAAFNRSAHRVGGDFYDVLMAGDGGVLAVVADVMGKGVLAAMFAAILRTALRALADLADRPAMLIAQANRLLYEELSDTDLFITVQAAFLNPKRRQLTVASAGHCPLLVGGIDGDVRCVSPDGMPLGISPDTRYVDEVVELSNQCRVLLYTDGLTEAMNAKGARFGQDRLVSWFGQAKAGPGAAEELKRDLGETLGRFQAKTVLNDDQTFLIITSNDGYSNPGRGR